MDRSRPIISSPSGRLATWPNHQSLLWTSCVGMLVRRRRRHSSAVGKQPLRLMCKMRRMLSLPKTDSILLSAGFRNCRAESIAPLPGRSCSVYTTIFNVGTKARIANKRMRFAMKIEPMYLNLSASSNGYHQAGWLSVAHRGWVFTLPWLSKR